ncbi:PAS domain-containing protein [Leptospira sp. 201903075]|nr:PAS domain-containing protein [Leptospira chreensis]
MDFPVIGVGASAGGLEALELFFKHLPKDTGYCFVVILHIDPDHKGMIPEILQRYTPLPVYAAIDGVKVKPNTIYVLPANKSITIANRILTLSKPIEARGFRLPIDLFLTSLAKDIKTKSVGIILSGMGHDGGVGLQSIRNENGFTFIQDPTTAKFDGMPLNAIDSVNADFIASPDELATELRYFLESQPEKKTSDLSSEDSIKSLKVIQLLLKQKSGHDFTNYKNNTLFRRIERRLIFLNLTNIQLYEKFVTENPDELLFLFKEILIGVTHFFRDKEVWENIEKLLVDDVFEKNTENIIRIWIPGCSTGEEAYSLAIIFLESKTKEKKYRDVKFQIFATDLDEDAITKARQGIYQSNIEKDVSSERLTLFFSKIEGGYRINPSVRELVIFANHDIIKDPPFTKLNFISCRNMLIYMEPNLQRKVLGLFRYCLKPEGYLILGTAETLGSQNQFFRTVDSKLKIFTKNLVSSRNEQLDFPTSFKSDKFTNFDIIKIKESEPNIQSLTDTILLREYSPASILTNEKGDILYITGKTGKYLEPAAGKAILNIFIMAREGLRHEIIIAFRKAIKSTDPISLKSLKITLNSGIVLVDVIIRKIEKPDTLSGLFLVVFADVPTLIPIEKENNKEIKNKQHSQILVLKAELQRTKEELQLTIEEMQTSEEELKSTNEELQSTNEEMQSTNEELTSSKEEMQSLNEELQTVNIELQNKIDEYILITNDFKNLLDGTDVATIFLDKELRIRRYTKQVSRVFNMIPSDIGRPIMDLGSKLDYPDFFNDAKEVLETLLYKEIEIQSTLKIWYLAKIMPYRTIDDRILGLVITFTNITKTKDLEFALRNINDALDIHLTEVQNLLSEKEIILKEVHHRIKNNMGTVYGILNLQADAQSDVNMKGILVDASCRVQSMMTLYDKLYRSRNSVEIDVSEYLPDLIGEIIGIFPEGKLVSKSIQLEKISLTAGMISTLGIILNELVTNSMKYAFKIFSKGEITLQIKKIDNQITCIYGDNGIGIPESINLESSTGFGLELLRILVKQLRGTIQIDRNNGTKFTIKFPLKYEHKS